VQIFNGKDTGKGFQYSTANFWLYFEIFGNDVASSRAFLVKPTNVVIELDADDVSLSDMTLYRPHASIQRHVMKNLNVSHADLPFLQCKETTECC
jgi:hypothetical protein